jgi:hypothetical protein
MYDKTYYLKNKAKYIKSNKKRRKKLLASMTLEDVKTLNKLKNQAAKIYYQQNREKILEMIRERRKIDPEFAERLRNNVRRFRAKNG